MKFKIISWHIIYKKLLSIAKNYQSTKRSINMKIFGFALVLGLGCGRSSTIRMGITQNNHRGVAMESLNMLEQNKRG